MLLTLRRPPEFVSRWSSRDSRILWLKGEGYLQWTTLEKLTTTQANITGPKWLPTANSLDQRPSMIKNFSFVEMNNYKMLDLMWTIFKPLFQKEFGIHSNDKLSIHRLTNLAMEHGETTLELLIRITKTMVVITESYETYQNKPARPQYDINVSMSNNTCTSYINKRENNYFISSKALPQKFWHIVWSRTKTS